jgi:subtilase family serine protease
MAACSSNGASTVPTSPSTGGNAALSFSYPTLPGELPANVIRACDVHVAPESAHCDALIRTDVVGPQARVAGYGPPDLQSAYNLPSSTNGAGQTVAIVDAFDDPNAEADLQVYRSNFSLPACTSSNACFAKLNQLGQVGPYPVGNAGWASEISLDVDMVSAGCPNCHIMLVEANDNSFKNLGIAVDEAVKLGAQTVSNSYSGGLTKKVRKRYDHPGHIILASAGDAGYGIGTPAGFPSVISVGGTALTRSSGSRPWTESVWGGTGSGCTPYTKPAYQHDTGCAGRTSNDVSAVASPGTGVAVYDTYQSHGWQVFGGTSVSSPLLGSVYGLAGNGAHLNYGQRFYEKKHAKDLFDVTTGSNGTCNPSYLCTGEVGYDGPTGNGTPNGVGAF